MVGNFERGSKKNVMRATPPPKDIGIAGISPSELLEKALASLDEAILVVAPATRSIVSCNRAAEEIFGYPREEIIGRNTEFLHLDHERYEQFGKELFPALNANGVFHKEYMMRRRDGSVFPTDHTVTEIRDTLGNRVAVVSAVRDIADRKRMEDALSASEEHYRSLFENSHTVMLVIAPADGAIVDANPSATAYYGWTKEELTRKKISDINTLTPEQVKAEMELAHAEKRSHFIFKHRRAQGEPRDVEVYSGPIRAQGRDLLYSIIFDIAERKLAEDTLRESETRFRQLAEATFEGIVISESGRIMDVNKSFLEMFGYENIGELAGKSLLELAAPGYHELATAHIAAGYEKAYEIMGVRKDGSYFPIEVHGRTMDITGRRIRISAARDMTERKKAEKALRESEQRFLRFFMMVPVPLGVVNNDGVITYFNDQFTGAFGYTTDDMPTIKEWWERAYPDETYRRRVMDTWGAAVAKAAKEGTDIEPIEYKVTCKNGEERIVLIGGAILEDSVLATFVDITERKRAEEKLIVSERELLNAQKFAHMGSWELDLQTGKETWSDETYRMYGFTPGAFEPTFDKFMEIVHPDDRKTIRDYFPEILSGRLSQAEHDMRIIRPDGQERVLLDKLGVITDEGGRPVKITGVNFDITERKRAEMALGDSENRLREAIINSPNPAMLHAEDGQVLLISRSWTEITGYALSDIPTTAQWTAKAYGENANVVEGQIERLYELSEIKKEGEYHVCTASGDIHIWDFQTAPLPKLPDGRRVLLSMAVDITKRKEAEREREHLTLKLSQKVTENEAILASQSNVVLSYDMNMNVQQVNPSFQRIYGFNPLGLNVKEIIRRVNCRMIDGSPLNMEEQPTPRALRGKETDNMLYQVTKAGGALGFVETSSRPLLIEDRIVGSVTVWHDITELKIKEDELRAAKEEAEAATKLKDQFVSLVAHDLRSPFTSMMGLLRLLAERKPYFEDEGNKKAFGLVFESGDRMLKMIEDLLKISRLQTGQITPNLRFFKGHMAAAVTIGSLSHLALQKGIVIMNDVPVDTRLYADQSLFDEVLLNLLSNAIKFCSRGDKITFFIPPGLKSAIAVRDTGKGISEAAIPNLFKHEVKTTTVGTAGERGTGLGLPYSHDIMKAHGGDMTVESAPGRGSVFTAMLPYVKPVALVVDDEVAVRMLARIHLEKVGIDIIEAVDGEKALSSIKERRPHIVITDINMPGMDGFMLLDRLKQDISTRDIPVIVITAMETETRENAFRHGADDFVSKPIEAEDFIPRVRRFVG